MKGVLFLKECQKNSNSFLSSYLPLFPFWRVDIKYNFFFGYLFFLTSQWLCNYSFSCVLSILSWFCLIQFSWLSALLMSHSWNCPALPSSFSNYFWMWLLWTLSFQDKNKKLVHYVLRKFVIQRNGKIQRLD